MGRPAKLKPPTINGKFGRHARRALLKWKTAGNLPSYHFLAARALTPMVASPSMLRRVLGVDNHTAHSLLAQTPEFRRALGEYMTSRWARNPDNYNLIAACADEEHPLFTPRPHHLWLLHGVIGTHPGFHDYCTLVLHAQFERKQSTVKVKNDTFTNDYLAVMALIAAAQPQSLFATRILGVQPVRKWDGYEFSRQPEKDFGFSLNQYHASLIERLRGGVLTGLRESVLKIVIGQLMP